MNNCPRCRVRWGAMCVPRDSYTTRAEDDEVVLTVGIPRISADMEVVVAKLLADALAEDVPYPPWSAVLGPFCRKKTQIGSRVCMRRCGQGWAASLRSEQTHDISTRARIGPTLVL